MAGEQTPLHRGATELLSRPLAVFGMALLAIMIAVALLAPLVASQNPYDPAQSSASDGLLPPGSTSSAGTTYWLGTDDSGRDMLSAILYGLRISLLVGVASAAMALVIGIATGFSAVYFHAMDSLIMWIADIELSFPAILILIIAMAFLGHGIVSLVVALFLMQWAYCARAIRRAVRTERTKAYVEAARCLALPPWRIAFGHVLPNCLPSLVVVCAVQASTAIMLEATLSFLGLGLRFPTPSLGLLIADGYRHVLSGSYWISLFPGMALVLLLVGINALVDQIRSITHADTMR